MDRGRESGSGREWEGVGGSGGESVFERARERERERERGCVRERVRESEGESERERLEIRAWSDEHGDLSRTVARGVQRPYRVS
jgi:hypothetical protein